MTSPETKAVRALLVLFDHVPADFRHDGQTLCQRVEAWVAHAVEQVEEEVEGSDSLDTTSRQTDSLSEGP